MEETPDDRPSSLPSLGPPGSRRRRTIFFAVSGALLLAILIVFRGVLAPFLLALVVAYVLAPIANALTRLRIGKRHLPRWIAVLLIYIVLLSGLGTAVALGVPRIAREIQQLAREVPNAIHTVQVEWIPRIEERLRQAGLLQGPAVTTPPPPSSRNLRVVRRADGSYDIVLPRGGLQLKRRNAREWRISAATERPGGGSLSQSLVESIRSAFSDSERYTETALRSVQSFIGSVIGGIFSFFIMLMLSAYMLITTDRIMSFFRSLARPEKRQSFDELVARIDRGLAGVVRGQLVIACVNGVLSGIGFALFDVPYWPLLTVIATLLSIIPIFGAIISSVPAVFFALQNGVGTALLTLVWIIGIHQLEANVLNPKIMGDAAKVHPVLVVFALLAGEHLFGVTGALLAVPVLSITQSVFLHFREVALGVPRDPALAAKWAEATLDRAPPDEKADP